MIETYSVVFKKNNTKAYDLTFNYTYDNYHQVTEIKYTDNLPFETEEITLAKYTYDVLGQLLTEYDLNSGEYNEYTYDNQGNVLTKTMYDNTAFSFSNGQITHPANYSYKVLSYTYDTSVYNKLTSYTLKQYDHSANSNTEVETTLQTKNLTYDALGNLNDYTAEIDGTSTNYDLCWAGDKLVLAAANNYGYSYQYDDSGRLIKKSKIDTDMIPEMEINYIWKGDLLDGYQINIYESFLTVTIKNLYDENNHLIGLNYHYAVFYGQGDQSQMSTEDFFPNDSIDENSIMLLTINNIVSQRSFQLTQSARVFLDLSIEAEDSSFMYAYKNISSMDNVDYSDYNTFDYISNGNNENNLLDKVEITDSNLYSFEITKAYDSWSKGFCPNDGLAFCASSSDNYYAAYYAEMFVLRTYTIIQPSVCENNHVVDMDEAGLVHIDPYLNTLMVQREETPGVSTTLPVDIQHIYEQYKYGRGHSCKI